MPHKHRHAMPSPLCHAGTAMPPCHRQETLNSRHDFLPVYAVECSLSLGLPGGTSHRALRRFVLWPTYPCCLFRQGCSLAHETRDLTAIASLEALSTGRVTWGLSVYTLRDEVLFPNETRTLSCPVWMRTKECVAALGSSWLQGSCV